MSSGALYRKGCALRDRLERLKLSELLALNPTLQDIRHILEVMAIGYGKNAVEWHVQEVQKLLRKEIAKANTDVSQESELFENFTRKERTVRGGLVVAKGSEVPWLTPTGVGTVKVFGIRRREGVVEFGIGNEEPPILGWVTAEQFWPEFPD